MLFISALGARSVPSIHDTAYPRLKTNPNPEELTAIYTPTSEEITFADQTTRSKVTHLSFVILLRTFQRLGYAVMISRIPTSIIRHIATTLQQSMVVIWK